MITEHKTPKYTCPCCGYITLVNGPGLYDVCPICYWEDDISQLRFPTTIGANKVSLLDAQRNFVSIGAVEEHFSTHVRRPTSEDRRDPSWRPLAPQKDIVEIPKPGKDYGDTYPKDPKDLYYWKNNI
jgi:hypothetical protein